MATVISPNTCKVQTRIVPVAKYYEVDVVPCPARRGNLRGSVEKSVHFAIQRIWRTMTGTTTEDARRCTIAATLPSASSRTRYLPAPGLRCVALPHVGYPRGALVDQGQIDLHEE